MSCLRIRKKKYKQGKGSLMWLINIVSTTLPKCKKDMRKDEYIWYFKASLITVAHDFGYSVDIHESTLFNVPAFRITFTRNPECKPKPRYSKHIIRTKRETIYCTLPKRYDEA